MRENPIGIFDSGIGGLSVWNEIRNNLPMEDIVYFADSKFCPYGEKKEQDILDRSIKIVETLLQHHCKLIVVACNTATAAAIETLRSKFKIPFVGMEPAIKPAALNTKTGKIGVLATEGTFNGALFKTTHEKYAQNIETITQAGYGLVELVELGQQNSLEAKYLIEKYISPMIRANADHIVLGCTHYPFLIDSIKQITPEHIKIVNPAPAIAQRTIQLLADSDLLNNSNKKGSDQFFTSGNKTNLKAFIDNNFQLNCETAQLIF